MYINDIFAVTLIRKRSKNDTLRVVTWIFSDREPAQKFMKRFCEGLDSPYWAQVYEDHKCYGERKTYPITKKGFVVGYLYLSSTCLNDYPSNDYEQYYDWDLMDNAPDIIYYDEEGDD